MKGGVVRWGVKKLLEKLHSLFDDESRRKQWAASPVKRSAMGSVREVRVCNSQQVPDFTNLP